MKKIFNEVNFWLIKSEPDVYSWEKFCSLGRDMWEGVRNFQARNYLLKMKIGDLAFFYHSNRMRAIVGIAQVVREAYQDPTAREGNWFVVDFQPYKSLHRAVSLAQMKSDPRLKDMLLIRQPRLSVMPLTKEQFYTILEMAETTL